jgi:hypothetical protein
VWQEVRAVLGGQSGLQNFRLDSCQKHWIADQYLTVQHHTLETQLAGALFVALLIAKQENMPSRLINRLVNLTQTDLVGRHGPRSSIRFFTVPRPHPAAEAGSGKALNCGCCGLSRRDNALGDAAQIAPKYCNGSKH